MADTAVNTNTVSMKSGKKSGPSLGDHLKHQNIFFYLSAITSIALIVMLFLPWITASESGAVPATKNASILDLILKSQKNIDLLICMIPVVVGFIGTQVAYLISLLRPGHDAFYPGTAIVLLAGIQMFLFIFASDSVFNLVSKCENTESFLCFIGATAWSFVPLTWFVLTLVQKLLLTRFAHKKKTY